MIGVGEVQNAPLSEMSQTFSNNQIEVLIVFRSVQASLDVRNDTMTYWFEVGAVYLKEK